MNNPLSALRALRKGDPLDALPAPRTSHAVQSYDWVLLMWDAKDRVVSREPGNDIGVLVDHAEAMLAERSIADWEIVCTWI